MTNEEKLNWLYFMVVDRLIEEVCPPSPYRIKECGSVCVDCWNNFFNKKDQK